MAETPSKMVALGTEAIDFELIDTISNKSFKLSDFKNDFALVIMFICNHCPFVININSEMVKIAKFYKNHGVNFIAISSNDIVKYPQDGPNEMKIHAKKENYPFYDVDPESGKIIMKHFGIIVCLCRAGFSRAKISENNYRTCINQPAILKQLKIDDYVFNNLETI